MPLSVTEAKQVLRRKIKARRRELSAEDIKAKSLSICDRAIGAVDWRSVDTVHCFTSIGYMGEVDTVDIFDYIRQNQSGMAVYTTTLNSGAWVTSRVKGGKLEKTAYAMPAFDVVFVPMLAFDSRLHRLGYGKGYYDKFLAAQPQAFKIGLCFELGRLADLPVEPHDVSLDMVITEKSKITC